MTWLDPWKNLPGHHTPAPLNPEIVGWKKPAATGDDIFFIWRLSIKWHREWHRNRPVVLLWKPEEMSCIADVSIHTSICFNLLDKLEMTFHNGVPNPNNGSTINLGVALMKRYRNIIPELRLQVDIIERGIPLRMLLGMLVMSAKNNSFSTTLYLSKKYVREILQRIPCQKSTY